MALALVLACTTCDAALQARIFGPRFGEHLAMVALPLLFGSLFVVIVVHHAVAALDRRSGRLRVAPLATAGTLLGLGMGAFLDGILLHHVLQWHQMMTSIVPAATVETKNFNMFWDGIFHLGAWSLTAAGIVLLYRLIGRTDVSRSAVVLLGSALLGWGAFNVVDGTFNHYVLRLHDVREITASPWAWNLGFLLLGIGQVLLGGGIVLARSRTRHAAEPRATGARAPQPT
jgi:uncharacterized membrane protein